MDQATSAIKIQALWRGYRSRKGEVLPCCRCGYDMTLRAPSEEERVWAVFASQVPCSWCQEQEAHSCDCLECRQDLGPCPCADCKSEPKKCSCAECPGGDKTCEVCGGDGCDGRCEPYIPCSSCGSNCYGEDYEKWRFCSRRCMVGWARD